MNSKQVAELFDISIDTVRYYERVGVIPPITRDKNGYRIYTTSTLNWIFLAKSLRRAGVTIESLIEFATLSQMGGSVRENQKQILKDQLIDVDEKLNEMTKARALLKHKIDTFDEHVAKFNTGELTSETVEELWKMKHFNQKSEDFK